VSNRRRLQSRLEELLKQYDKQIEQTFLQAIRARVNSINLAQLTKAIEERDFNRAVSIAGITRADLFPFDSSVSAAYAAAGQSIPAAAPAFAVAFGFDGRATRAEQWARNNVGGLVTGIVDEQVIMLREIIGDQLAAGINPKKIALEIAGPMVNGSRQGGFIGLSRPQAGYLFNARNELANLDSGYFKRVLRDKRFDSLVRKAIASGKPLAQADIDRIAARYSDRLLRHRAETIARTESITALRAGRREGVQQGIEAGSIARDAIKRVWNSTGDNRTRQDHRVVNGQTVNGMDEAFTLPDGSRMLFPGDKSLGAPAAQTVNCRCYDEYVVDWLRG
jgi:hypothetical protein